MVTMNRLMLALWITLSCTGSQSAATTVTNSCPQALQSQSDVLYLSSPDSAQVSEYLTNARDAHLMEKTFVALNQNSNSTELSFESFVEHLAHLHRTLALGTDKQNAYRHPGSGSNHFMTQNIRPGVFRTKESNPGGLMYPFRQTDPREAKATAQSFQLGLSRFFPDVAMMPSSEHRGPFVYRIPIEGVDRTYWPENRAFKDSLGMIQIHHTYPSSSAPYLTRMHTLYRKLLEGPMVEKAPSLLQDIAQYYHYGIHAHLFRRINNSLLLLQVNTFLELYGFRGNYHRDLDVYAVNLNFEDFFAKFKEWLQEANPPQS